MAKVKEVNRYDEFLALQKSWSNVLNKSKERNVFLSWEWLSTWWKHYGKGRELLILLIEDKDQIIAIAPLMCSEYSAKLPTAKLRKIEFIGTGPTDYQNFILTKKKIECLRLFMNYLSNHPVEWDFLELKEIPETAYFIDFLHKTNMTSNKFEERVSSICPYILLPETWEVFFKGLGRNMRRNLHRYLRQLKEKHKIEFKTYLDFESIEEAMEVFFDLHQKRWRSKGQGGLFSDQVFREFHIDVARCFAERGWLSLCFLTIDDMPIASKYGFKYNGKMYCYLSGFDPAYFKYGVGNLTSMYLIEDCIRNGLREYDFLKGSESYKRERWGNVSIRKNIKVWSIGGGLFPKMYGWITKSDNQLVRKLKYSLRFVSGALH